MDDFFYLYFCQVISHLNLWNLIMHVVYILKSQKSGRYYCGEAADFKNRIERHNQGRLQSTKAGVPWELVRLINCEDRGNARILESKIKGRGIGRSLDENPK